jgi:hypothetical protein
MSSCHHGHKSASPAVTARPDASNPAAYETKLIKCFYRPDKRLLYDPCKLLLKISLLIWMGCASRSLFHTFFMSVPAKSLNLDV